MEPAGGAAGALPAAAATPHAAAPRRASGAAGSESSSATSARSPSPSVLQQLASAHAAPAAPLLRERLSLRPRADGRGLELEPLPCELSFEKGVFVVVRALQLLRTQQPGKVIVVGLAGPSGAGKTELSRRLRELTPLTVLSLDMYCDTSQLVDGNFDDPRLTDFGRLTANLEALKAGHVADVPIYDFKLSRRVGSTPVTVSSGGVVLVEGIYALHSAVRQFLDLTVAVSGGVHFDLIKRIQRDVARCAQSPQEIIAQISETVFPMYKAFIEADLKSAAIRIRNSFNPFSGFLSNATYTLKSTAADVDPAAVRAVLAGGPACDTSRVEEEAEQTVDLYLMPPGEDAETCRDWIRMRLRDGRYSLVFEEAIADGDVIISPSMAFEVPVRTLSGLMALGYTLGAILRRDSTVMRCDGLTAKFDTIVQLRQRFFQIEGRDRAAVEHAAAELGLGGTYVARSYIEQVQLDRLMQECPPLLEECGFLPSPAAQRTGGGDESEGGKGTGRAVAVGLTPLGARGLAPHSPGGTRLHTRAAATAREGPPAADEVAMRPPGAATTDATAAAAAAGPGARRALRMDAADASPASDAGSAGGASGNGEAAQPLRPSVGDGHNAAAAAAAAAGSSAGAPAEARSSAFQAGGQPGSVVWLAQSGSFASSYGSFDAARGSQAPATWRAPSAGPPALTWQAAAVEDKLTWLEARMHALAWAQQQQAAAAPPFMAPPLDEGLVRELRALARAQEGLAADVAALAGAVQCRVGATMGTNGPTRDSGAHRTADAPIWPRLLAAAAAGALAAAAAAQLLRAAADAARR